MFARVNLHAGPRGLAISVAQKKKTFSICAVGAWGGIDTYCGQFHCRGAAFADAIHLPLKVLKYPCGLFHTVSLPI